MLLHEDALLEEVDVAHAQAEYFALSKTASGRQNCDRVVTVRQCVDHNLDSLLRPGFDPLAVNTGRLDRSSSAGIARDEPVVYGGGEYG